MRILVQTPRGEEQDGIKGYNLTLLLDRRSCLQKRLDQCLEGYNAFIPVLRLVPYTGNLTYRQQKWLAKMKHAESDIRKCLSEKTNVKLITLHTLSFMHTIIHLCAYRTK